MLSIHVGELLMQLAPEEADGFVISPDGFTGWDGGVDMRFETTARPTSHGDFDVPGRLGGRIVSFSGYAFAQDHASMDALGQQLTGLLADGSSTVVSVNRPSGTQWAVGRLAAATKFEVRGVDPTVADWQLQLRFADPRKYGTSRMSSSTAGDPTYHFGNFAALPVIKVTGNAPDGYTLFGPDGREFDVLEPLEPGHPHTIRMRDGALLLDGQQIAGGTGYAETWSIPPGVQVQHEVTAGASLSIETFDTYI